MVSLKDNIRKYGQAPFRVALIHGGPGAPGEMKPVAEELSKDFGILEPLQTADSIDGQVEELKSVLKQKGELPIILVGYSWGAWLAYILTARYPELVSKLILVGSGPFEASYTKNMMETRMNRLSEEEKAETTQLIEGLNDGSTNPGDLKKLGELMSKADSYNPEDKIKIEVNQAIYEKVWPEASKLRENGELLEIGGEIQCPVVAIHGDYDSHPYEGVKEPLSRIIKDFRFILINKCGHTPWIEKGAKEEFYSILRQEIS